MIEICNGSSQDEKAILDGLVKYNLSKVPLRQPETFVEVCRAVKDEEGNVIVYTVSEVWEHQDWIAIYGEIIETNTSPPRYETTVTNNYRWGRGVELPSTGGLGQGIWIFSGYVIMAGAVISLYLAKRKNGRRIK